MTSDDFLYEGADLESMDLADNYHGWILDHFNPQLGARIVEVGAGTGSFSRLIADRRHPEAMYLIEPSKAMFGELQQTVADRPELHAQAANGFLAGEIEGVREFAPQSFVYVNVLEHVEHDKQEIAQVFELLPPGGTLCAFVPALPALYSEFDRSIGHFRRYTLAELRGKCEAAGFEIVEARYFDFVGILPWYVRFRLMKSKGLSPGAVKLFDKVAVPVLRVIERFIKPPVGKNVLVIGRRPG